MPKSKRSRTQNKINNLEQYNRVNRLLIFKKQLELTMRLMERLPISCAEAGFNAAPEFFTRFKESFEGYGQSLIDVVDTRLDIATDSTIN